MMPDTGLPEIRLNEQARRILAARLQNPGFKERFALVFLGDTHIGKECRNDIDCSQMYTRLLQAVIGDQERSRDILAIIHGGDGTHKGGQHLEQFTYLTRNTLNLDKPDIQPIPLFMNIGNHEYINDPDGEQYRKWVADPGPVQFIWFDELKWGVVLLNTGAQNRGYLPQNMFDQALHTIGREMERHRGYQVVLDMHIPPSIGPHSLHFLSLNCRYSRQLRQLLNKYPRSIAAVTTHHRHWACMTERGWYYKNRTPIYLTAYGGHCDCPRFSCLKLIFQQQDGKWKLSNQLLTLPDRAP